MTITYTDPDPGRAYLDERAGWVAREPVPNLTTDVAALEKAWGAWHAEGAAAGFDLDLHAGYEQWLRKFNPAEPRVGAGSAQGGEWTAGGSSGRSGDRPEPVILGAESAKKTGGKGGKKKPDEVLARMLKVQADLQARYESIRTEIGQVSNRGNQAPPGRENQLRRLLEKVDVRLGKVASLIAKYRAAKAKAKKKGYGTPDLPKWRRKLKPGEHFRFSHGWHLLSGGGGEQRARRKAARKAGFDKGPAKDYARSGFAGTPHEWAGAIHENRRRHEITPAAASTHVEPQASRRPAKAAAPRRLNEMHHDILTDAGADWRKDIHTGPAIARYDVRDASTPEERAYTREYQRHVDDLVHEGLLEEVHDPEYGPGYNITAAGREVQAQGYSRRGGGRGLKAPGVPKPEGKGRRILGAERQQMAKDYVKRYTNGESIKSLASSSERSYGFVHRILTESGVQLRQRGGQRRRRRIKGAGRAKLEKRNWTPDRWSHGWVPLPGNPMYGQRGHQQLPAGVSGSGRGRPKGPARGSAGVGQSPGRRRVPIDRGSIPSGDFVDHEMRRYPIVVPQDITDAKRLFNMHKNMPEAVFHQRLAEIARRKGPAFEAKLTGVRTPAKKAAKAVAPKPPKRSLKDVRRALYSTDNPQQMLREMDGLTGPDLRALAATEIHGAPQVKGAKAAMAAQIVNHIIESNSRDELGAHLWAMVRSGQFTPPKHPYLRRRYNRVFVDMAHGKSVAEAVKDLDGQIKESKQRIAFARRNQADLLGHNITLADAELGLAAQQQLRGVIVSWPKPRRLPAPAKAAPRAASMRKVADGGGVILTKRLRRFLTSWSRHPHPGQQYTYGWVKVPTGGRKKGPVVPRSRTAISDVLLRQKPDVVHATAKRIGVKPHAGEPHGKLVDRVASHLLGQKPAVSAVPKKRRPKKTRRTRPAAPDRLERRTPPSQRMDTEYEPDINYDAPPPGLSTLEEDALHDADIDRVLHDLEQQMIAEAKPRRGRPPKAKGFPSAVLLLKWAGHPAVAKTDWTPNRWRHNWIPLPGNPLYGQRGHHPLPPGVSGSGRGASKKLTPSQLRVLGEVEAGDIRIDINDRAYRQATGVGALADRGLVEFPPVHDSQTGRTIRHSGSPFRLTAAGHAALHPEPHVPVKAAKKAAAPKKLSERERDAVANQRIARRLRDAKKAGIPEHLQHDYASSNLTLAAYRRKYDLPSPPRKASAASPTKKAPAAKALPGGRRLTNTEADHLSTAEFNAGKPWTSDRTRASLERDGFIDGQGRITDTGRAALAAHVWPKTGRDAVGELHLLRDDPDGLAAHLEGMNRTQLRAVFSVLGIPEPGSLRADNPRGHRLPLARDRATSEQLRVALLRHYAHYANGDKERRLRAHADRIESAAASPVGAGRPPAKIAKVPGGVAKKTAPAGKPHTNLTADEQARVRRLVRADPQIHATVHDRFGRVSSSGNLSEDDAAWLQDIYGRDRAFVERVAQDMQIERNIAEAARKAGQTPSEYRAATAARLKRLVAGKPIAVRVRDEAALQDIVSGGRVKTHLEGARRAPGLTGGPDARRLGEHILGVPPDAPMEERPVYGYVAINGIEPALSPGVKIPGIREREGQEDVLSSYGQIQIVLRSGVRSRTTMTVGDSLDEIGFMRPSPVDNPTAESLGHRSLDSVMQPGWTRRGYVEAQIHGGVRASDIDEVVFPSPPSAALARQLDDARISYRVLRPGESSTGGVAKKTAPVLADGPALRRTPHDFDMGPGVAAKYGRANGDEPLYLPNRGADQGLVHLDSQLGNLWTDLVVDQREPNSTVNAVARIGERVGAGDLSLTAAFKELRGLRVRDQAVKRRIEQAIGQMDAPGPLPKIDVPRNTPPAIRRWLKEIASVPTMRRKSGPMYHRDQSPLDEAIDLVTRVSNGDRDAAMRLRSGGIFPHESTDGVYHLRRSAARLFARDHVTGYRDGPGGRVEEITQANPDYPAIREWLRTRPRIEKRDWTPDRYKHGWVPIYFADGDALDAHLGGDWTQSTNAKAPRGWRVAAHPGRVSLAHEGDQPGSWHLAGTLTEPEAEEFATALDEMVANAEDHEPDEDLGSSDVLEDTSVEADATGGMFTGYDNAGDIVLGYPGSTQYDATISTSDATMLAEALRDAAGTAGDPWHEHYDGRFGQHGYVSMGWPDLVTIGDSRWTQAEFEIHVDRIDEMAQGLHGLQHRSIPHPHDVIDEDDPDLVDEDSIGSLIDYKLYADGDVVFDETVQLTRAELGQLREVLLALQRERNALPPYVVKAVRAEKLRHLFKWSTGSRRRVEKRDWTPNRWRHNWVPLPGNPLYGHQPHTPGVSAGGRVRKPKTKKERISDALDYARRSRSGNPYFHVGAWEKLTPADFRGLSDEDKERLRDGVAEVVRRTGLANEAAGAGPGEAHLRAVAIRDKWGTRAVQPQRGGQLVGAGGLTAVERAHARAAHRKASKKLDDLLVGYRAHGVSDDEMERYHSVRVARQDVAFQERRGWPGGKPTPKATAPKPVKAAPSQPAGPSIATRLNELATTAPTSTLRDRARRMAGDRATTLDPTGTFIVATSRTVHGQGSGYTIVEATSLRDLGQIGEVGSKKDALDLAARYAAVPAPWGTPDGLQGWRYPTTGETAGETMRGIRKEWDDRLALPPVPKTPRRGGETRRGDLVILEEPRDAARVDGQWTKQPPGYRVGLVTAVSTRGKAAKVRFGRHETPVDRLRRDHKLHLVPAEGVDREAALGAMWPKGEYGPAPRTFASLEEARSALAPHARTAPTPVARAVKPKPLKPLVPKPSGKPYPFAPKPGTGEMREPVGGEPGAFIRWQHRTPDGTTIERTGRVWDRAPGGRDSVWVVPDQRLPEDAYHALAIDFAGGTERPWLTQGAARLVPRERIPAIQREIADLDEKIDAARQQFESGATNPVLPSRHTYGRTWRQELDALEGQRRKLQTELNRMIGKSLLVVLNKLAA